MSTSPAPSAAIAGRSSYLEILESAWQQHLAPWKPDAPTVISTFAGCGGSSLGYSMAGYRELLAVEWDDNAVATFRLNFSDVPVYHGDIAKLSVKQCMEMAGIGPGELDVLDGSPPCQGFSTAGKRVLDDPRNGLFREYVRLLRGLRPRCFVMENVSGMVKGKMKLVFAEIMRELKASGYRVSARLMNAMYFNVPQSRERMIFIGVREDVGKVPSHPKAQGLPITVREAWQGLNAGEVLMITAGNERHTAAGRPPARSMDEPSPTLVKAGNSCVALPSVSALKVRRWSETKPGCSHPKRFSLQRLAWNEPSPTIQKSSSGTAGTMHPSTPRHLSGEELKRLASFADPFRFTGTHMDVTARIGNSVPPLFMRAIAGHIRREILES